MKYPGYEWFTTPHWMRRFGPLKLVGGSLLDRVGLHYFGMFMLFNGVLGGSFTLGAVVLKKTLGANDMMIGVYAAMSVVVLLLGIFGSEVVQGRDKRPFIFWVGGLSRLSFLLFFFCRDALSFIAVAVLFFVLHALVMPATFAMWQANVSTEARNRLWGMSVAASTVVSMVSAYLAGLALDHDPWSYTWFLPLAGLIGLVGILILAQSPLRGKYKLDNGPVKLSFKASIQQPISGFFRLLKEDKRFREFEIAFFFYGFALMLLFPVMPIFMVDVAKMSYGQMGIASGILAQIGTVFLPPMWGKLMDRVGPPAMCIIVFALLALFPGIMLVSQLATRTAIPMYIAVYVGYAIFGMAMAGVSVAWSLGPVFFAGKRDASRYSGAHVTITGIRGMFGPMLGALGVTYLGFAPVFAVSTVLFVLGALGMVLVNQRAKGLAQAVKPT